MKVKKEKGKDKYYLEIRNPYTKELELTELHLVRDTLEESYLEKNEVILNIPANDYYFKIKDLKNF